MHHLHISGFALFLIAVFVLGLTAIILAFISSSRQARREAEIEMERVKRGERSTGAALGDGYRFGSGGSTAQANAYAGSHAARRSRQIAAGQLQVS